MPAAYFDVDGTLISTNLVHTTVMYLANQSSPLKSARRLGTALLSGPVMAWAELKDRRLFNELLFSHYKGTTEDRMVVVSEDVFEFAIRPNIFEGTVDLIDKCKAAGQRIVLVTGSLDCTVKPLAEYLGVEHIIANRLEMKDGKATGKLMRPIVAGPGKARIIADDARAHGDDLADCFGYSDSYSDVPMLSVVGHPFCVNPDRKLKRLAEAYNWPVLDITSQSRTAQRDARFAR